MSEVLFRYDVGDQNLFQIVDSESRLLFTFNLSPSVGNNSLNYELLKRDGLKCQALIKFLNMGSRIFLLDNLILINDEFSRRINIKIGNQYRSVFEFYFKLQDDIKSKISDAVRT